jgi:hypothetical protein
MQTTRREFFRNTAMFGIAAVGAKMLAACATADDGGVADGNDDNLSEISDELAKSCGVPTISANHGHTLKVSAADANAGVGKTYTTAGTATHKHKVTITSAQFAQLAAGRSITVLSTTIGGHSHSVTVTCLAAAPAACGHGATARAISENHGHSLTVSAADAAAGVAKSYSIAGSAGHDHTITISAANFVSLKAGQSIVVNSSSTFAHTHAVTVTCA